VCKEQHTCGVNKKILIEHDVGYLLLLGRGVRSLKFLTPTPKLFNVFDSDSCLNSKVNYLKAVAIDTPVDPEI